VLSANLKKHRRGMTPVWYIVLKTQETLHGMLPPKNNAGAVRVAPVPAPAAKQTRLALKTNTASMCIPARRMVQIANACRVLDNERMTCLQANHSQHLLCHHGMLKE
jgi:hypothetical protein